MTTRLDRLLLLLDTGSTPSVRLTAARQLGQIAAQTIQHSSVSVLTSSSLTPNVGPSTTQSDWRGVDGEWQEIVNLLGRILPYLRSKSWETRQAASEAVDAICKAKSANQNTRPENWLTYQNFNLDAVLSEGLILLASAGKEFDYQSTHLRSGESLIAAQRDVANKLGLGVLGPIDFESMGVDDPVINSNKQIKLRIRRKFRPPLLIGLRASHPLRLIPGSPQVLTMNHIRPPRQLRGSRPIHSWIVPIASF
ncbi:hypothetical protein PSTT_15760 [Puccinia striiformis]|uniref:Uncharacterized protein n=1 Tax=Puccinia striiformis TaxID=27350 RepID=A0A2S4UGB9_9BASI|nr:hypothetical protein PSTT_15760 [Puccinia striiformis]